ncbi:hypothetical protein ES708_09253 [subsurface metagenome]
MCFEKKIVRIVMLFTLSLMALTLHAQTLITLDKAIDIAGVNSPDIQRSRLNLQRYRESLNAQRASLKSQFKLNLTPAEYSNTREFNPMYSEWYTNETFRTSGTFRVDQRIPFSDGTLSLVNNLRWQKSKSDFQNVQSDNESFVNYLYLSLNQPLFTYNQTKLDLKEIELAYENASISYTLQTLNLEKNVTQFFYNVYMAQMNLTIAQEELENTEESYAIIKNKVDAGLAAREELYQSELNLATAKSSLQNQEVTLENAKDEFTRFLGMNLYEEILIAADITTSPVEVDMEKAVNYGLNSRMELRQREIDLQSSQFQLIRTKAMNEFRGDMELSIGLTGDNENFTDIYNNPTQNPRVAISFNIPIFDWGEREARIKAQEAVVQTQELNLSEEKKQIIIDIRKVYRNLINQQNQIDIAKQSEKNAQLTYEINLERYKNGDLTGMDLNLYQTQLSEKKMAYVQALINYKIELLNLKIQTLYDFVINEPLVPEELFKDN